MQNGAGQYSHAFKFDGNIPRLDALFRICDGLKIPIEELIIGGTHKKADGSSGDVLPGRWKINKSLKTKVKRYAEAELRRYLDGKFNFGQPLTVKSYYESWIETKQPPLIRKSAVRDYKQHFSGYLLSEFGSTLLANLTVTQLSRFRAKLLACGLSVKTARNIIDGSFRAMWRDAMEERKWIITRSLCSNGLAGFARGRIHSRQRNAQRFSRTAPSTNFLLSMVADVVLYRDAAKRGLSAQMEGRGFKYRHSPNFQIALYGFRGTDQDNEERSNHSDMRFHLDGAALACQCQAGQRVRVHQQVWPADQFKEWGEHHWRNL